jgi:hypothetical protein
VKKIQQSFLLGLALILVACPNPIVPTKPVITAFTATPASLPVGGGSSNLTWVVTGADSLTIDQGVGVVTGTQKEVSVPNTTTFTLSATNSVGVTTQAVTVTVAQPPEPPANQISGVISPWTRGSRDLKGEIVFNSTITTVSGTLRQNGEISLTLPDQTTNLQPIFNPPNSLCVGNVVVTPADAVGTSLGRIAVRTAPTPFVTSKLSGYLYRVNNTSFASGTTTNLKQIGYVYINKATTVQGSCAYGNEVQEYDLNLKQGWNTVLSESVNTNKVKLSNSTIPPDVIWRFVPAGKISISINGKSNLEVGETVRLIAFGEDNYPFPGSDLTWTSASTGLEVNAEGLATAKASGTHFVTARLKIVPSIDTTNGVTVSNFLASGATYNLEDNALGTAIRLSFGNGSNLYPVSITGPQGWNNNQVLTITKTNTFTTSEVILSEIPPVTGTYTVKRGGFLTGGTTFAIDANNKLPTAKNLVVTNGVSPEATVQWNELPQQSVPIQYATEVIDVQTGQIVRAKATADSLTQASYNGLNLDKSKTYKFRVYAQSGTNNPTDAFLGASLTSVVLDFRPVIANLDYQGGFNTSNTLVVKGSNFAATNEVFLGTTQITNFTVPNENTLSFVIPNLPTGTVDLTIRNSRGISATSLLTKYSTFAVTEFSGFKPYKLLKGLNGEIHFLEWDATNASNVVQLSKLSENTTITRVVIPNVNHDEVKNMALNPNGDVWIAFRQKLVKVTPVGVVSEMVIPNGISAVNVAFGSDGLLWFTNRDSGKIGRIETNGTNLVEFTDPRLSFFSTNDQLQLGSDGNLWFTQSRNLGFITPAGAITWIQLSPSSQTPLLVDGNSILVRDSNRVITRISQPSEFIKYGVCNGNYLAMANNGFLWCGGSDFSSEKHLRRLDLSNTNLIAQNIFVDNMNQINEVISDSNGKIWFIIGNKISVFTP